MNSQIASPFVDAVTELMTSMVGVDCQISREVSLDNYESFVSGVITLSGNASGQVAVVFSQLASTGMVAQMLSLAPEEVDEEILRDGVGEIANIVAGNAKSKLAELGFDLKLSLPTIVTGTNHHVALFKSEWVSHYGVESPLGSFKLSVWLGTQ